MARPQFSVLRDGESHSREVPYEERLADHRAVLRAYFRTYEKRRYDKSTLVRVEKFLTSVFEGIKVVDATHPPGARQLFVWELLHPTEGPEIIDLFATSLNPEDYSQATATQYLGDLRRLGEFVLAKPYIPGRRPQSITEKYGPLAQPVSKYDRPVHTADPAPVGWAVTGVKLMKFLEYVRVGHVGLSQKKLTAQRDYAMIVLAVTSGARANELLNFDVADLLYEKNRIHVRFGKGSKGSGKRERLTIFTKFAQATTHLYETHIRPQFPNARSTPALFLTEKGERITYDAMWAALEGVVEGAREAGIELPEKFSWHDLRRSFATGYLEKHPDRLLKLAEFMGHAGLGTLNRYVLPSREAFNRATDALLRRHLPADAAI
jgi:integrase